MFWIKYQSCIGIGENRLSLLKGYIVFPPVFTSLVLIPYKRYCFHIPNIIIIAILCKWLLLEQNELLTGEGRILARIR